MGTRSRIRSQAKGLATGVCFVIASVLAIVCTAATPVAAAAQVIASIETAYVAEEQGGRAWRIGNEAITARLELASNGTFALSAISRPGADAAWDLGSGPELSFTTARGPRSPGAEGVTFIAARASTVDGAVQLGVVFEDSVSRLRVTRIYECSPGAPAIETWWTLETLAPASAVAVSDLGVWEVSLRARSVEWITGLGAGAQEGGPFTRRLHELSTGVPLLLGSNRRSSESAVPVFWLAGPPGHIFAGLRWSGAWSLSVVGPDASGRAAVRISLAETSTTVRPTRSLETPHAFFGVAGAQRWEVSAALHEYVTKGIRRGRPFEALVTYNTWFAYGNRIDEASLRAEMESVAALGVELFVVDAGWYPGGTQEADYSTGLGTWTADPRRFPSGLRALGDYARGLGMKFGIWVEPERVDVSTTRRAGLARERFLATVDGRYNPAVKNESATTAQICLADAEARQWLTDELVRFIEAVNPDYLKWDNNYWINCDRAGHGHDAADGNFEHVKGLYETLATLRSRFPDLLIENCASGGNRLDFGMLRYSDVAWMDDVTAPSAHVRHNVEGLGTVFPPAYLLSFVIDHAQEPIHEAADMPLYFRSRSIGVLGMTFRGAEFGEDDRRQMAGEIRLYKRSRQVLTEGIGVLLTDQVLAAGSSQSDVMEVVSSRTGSGVLHLFANRLSGDALSVVPVALDSDGTYTIRTRDAVLPGVTGEELMSSGLSLATSASAQLFFLWKQVPSGVP